MFRNFFRYEIKHSLQFDSIWSYENIEDYVRQLFTFGLPRHKIFIIILDVMRSALNKVFICYVISNDNLLQKSCNRPSRYQ